jgi:hypothetical protein
MAARLEEDTMRFGLLMEAAQAQQTLAAATLERLQQHTAGLDAVVREEIRCTLLDEMRALAEDSERAAEALRRLQRFTNMRAVAWSVAVTGLASVIPFALAWWMLPTRADLAALSSKRDALAVNIARLAREGGYVELRHCGTAQRLCVRVDRGAPAYGEGGDFRVVSGY